MIKQILKHFGFMPIAEHEKIKAFLKSEIATLEKEYAVLHAEKVEIVAKAILSANMIKPVCRDASTSLRFDSAFDAPKFIEQVYPPQDETMFFGFKVSRNALDQALESDFAIETLVKTISHDLTMTIRNVGKR